MTVETAEIGADGVIPLVYTINETCEVLRLSRYTVYELINMGELRSIKVGHRRLVTRADLIDFLEQKRKAAS